MPILGPGRLYFTQGVVKLWRIQDVCVNEDLGLISEQEIEDSEDDGLITDAVAQTCDMGLVTEDVD